MRFGLKLIFVVTFVVALSCGAMFSFPPHFGLLTLMAITAAMHAGCLACIVYGRGYLRAFAIGVSVSLVAAIILEVYSAYLICERWESLLLFDDSTNAELRIYYAEEWGISLVAGVAAMVGRWVALSNRTE